MPNYPLYEFGGRGPLIHLAVANGFPPETYRGVFEPLLGSHRVVSVLPRALWDDPGPPEQFPGWRQMADDMLAGLRQHNLSNVIAVGHSMGGVASTLAVLAEPGRFRALILLDPTFLPSIYFYGMRLLRMLQVLGFKQENPLAQGALRRRARFASVDEAFSYWRAKPLFHDWPDSSLRLYAQSITRRAADNGGVELRWPPAWEARYYQTAYGPIWRDLRRLRGLLPLMAVRGKNTNTFTAPALRRFRRIVPEAACFQIEGHGHLFPQSAPDETHAIIERWLLSLPAAGV